MAQASSENTTSLPSPNRRTFLQGTASALALTTAAAIPATAAAEAPAEITPALLAAYNSWLFMERRLLCCEMFPSNPELRRFAEGLVPVNTAADRFHLPLDPGLSHMSKELEEEVFVPGGALHLTPWR